MKLSSFSVTNFRSITTAHKMALGQKTVLVGKNNEGKSNLLKALDISMSTLQWFGRVRPLNTGFRESYLRNDRSEDKYVWNRDYPISKQDNRGKRETVFKVEFLLTDDEIQDFREEIKSNINGELPIEIRIGPDNKPNIRISNKKGIGSERLNKKAEKIAGFIGARIAYNYIPAVRTEQEAMRVVLGILNSRLRELEQEKEYLQALETIRELQEPVLKEVAKQIKEPLAEFLPNIVDVEVSFEERSRRNYFSRDFDIIIDDGVATSLSYKGDGVKSLAALGLLKSHNYKDGASVIAIEEPESHLHSGAIHHLIEIIDSLCENNQIVLTTHNPLFVDRNNLKANILVDSNKASATKDIKQIREVLGVKASDNLTNASCVLIVEGDTDVRSIEAILRNESKLIENAFKNNDLVVVSLAGANNLSYKLGLYKNLLCQCYVLLDSDEEGRAALSKAENQNLISQKNVTFTNCKGKYEAEFEDWIDPSVYSDRVLDDFNVNIATNFSEMRKWSDKMKSAFQNSGKVWNDAVAAQVKGIVSEAVVENPSKAILEIHKGPLDAMISAIEKMLNKK